MPPNTDPPRWMRATFRMPPDTDPPKWGYTYDCHTCDMRATFRTYSERRLEIDRWHMGHEFDTYRQLWPG